MPFNIEGKTTCRGKHLSWRHAPLLAKDPLSAWQGLLQARGLQESDAFFSPALSDLPDPFLMQDMEKAAMRLTKAVMRKERIHVFGDFDCDGVSGTSILVEALRAAGAPVTYSIPHRADDGHGIGIEAVQQAYASGVSLGLSVDTGTTCLEACNVASQLGFDLIITDHHLPDAVLPNAFALLNPAREDCGFADGLLCGTGVAFFLLIAVWKKLSEQNARPDYDLKQLLDRVAMATVADVMKLRGVNRVLVHFGLQQLRTNPSIGMASLLEVGKIKKNRISCETIGFHLAPRINAAGRMAHGEEAMALLSCQDADEALRLAKGLDVFNKERRKVEADTFKEAVSKLKNPIIDDEINAVLAVYDESWHAGVVGLVAGRLAREYNRPAAVGFVDGQNNVRVSLRGRPGFHIGELLHACSDVLLGFGGHAGAGGGTIKAGYWQDFVSSFEQAINHQQQSGLFANAVVIDGVLTMPALHIGLASRLQRFEPIGQGNPPCVWILHEVHIVDVRKLSGGVVRLQLSDGQMFAQAVVFGGGIFEQDLQVGVIVSLLGSLQPDVFRGGDAVQFVVEDVLRL
ncbi:MAG: single-stranded-DNA-specific exonuclease RecJ [Zetaproteobacteria bacterium CG2_30_46_52]|nr:MAG: single-stranded-DNA-specific exonuclease RecJ [Zetaproteobacteria bacterium CG2_30_46_52]